METYFNGLVIAKRLRTRSSGFTPTGSVNYITVPTADIAFRDCQGRKLEFEVDGDFTLGSAIKIIMKLDTENTFTPYGSLSFE